MATHDQPDPADTVAPVSAADAAPAAGDGHDAHDRHDASRERLRAALWKPSSAQVVVAVLLAALGFGVVTQVRSTEVDDSFAGFREQELIDVLSGLAGTNQRSQSEIARLEAARDELRSTSSRRRAALREAQSQSDNLGILAGVIPVTGPGLSVRIVAGDQPVSLGSFLDLIQELRSVGAEAMVVNDRVRLVAQSSFELGGDGLVVDGIQLRSPYVLEAIGDPDALAGALPFPDGPQDQLEADGATVTLDKLTTIEITAVRADP